MHLFWDSLLKVFVIAVGGIENFIVLSFVWDNYMYATFDMLKFSLIVRLRGHKQNKWINMSFTFICLHSLSLTAKLNFNRSKVAYSTTPITPFHYSLQQWVSSILRNWHTGLHNSISLSSLGYHQRFEYYERVTFISFTVWLT